MNCFLFANLPMYLNYNIIKLINIYLYNLIQLYAIIGNILT